MTINPESREYRPRVVITGLDSEGLSTFVHDGEAGARYESKLGTLVDLLAPVSLPVSIADEPLASTVELQPHPGSLVARMVTFPPDADWKGKFDFTEAVRGIENRAGDAASDGNSSTGMHVTETIDLIFCVEGEVFSVMEDGSEKLLTAGDILIQRGTNHAWSNRTDRLAIVVAVLISGHR